VTRPIPPYSHLRFASTYKLIIPWTHEQKQVVHNALQAFIQPPAVQGEIADAGGVYMAIEHVEVEPNTWLQCTYCLVVYEL